MSQKSLNEWDIIDTAINNSSIKRVNWKQILGMSLTEYITNFKLTGYNSRETYEGIVETLKLKGFDDEEIFRRLKISVAARYGEQKANENRIKQRGNK